MSTIEDYTLEAFLTALAQLNQPIEPELQATLRQISETLTTNPSQAVSQLYQLAQDYPSLTASYEDAYEQLQDAYEAKERHKLLILAEQTQVTKTQRPESLEPPSLIHVSQKILSDPDPIQRAQRSLRMTTAYEHALDVFNGNAETALRWLHRTNGALGVAPVELMSTDADAQKVHTVLGRIEYGVYS